MSAWTCQTAECGQPAEWVVENPQAGWFGRHCTPCADAVVQHMDHQAPYIVRRLIEATP